MDNTSNNMSWLLAQVITFALWTLPVLTVGCNFGASPNCLFPCHCADAGPCDPVNGTCAAGCDDGNPQEYEWPGAWSGPGCQIGNIAFQKHTNFTDTEAGNFSASLAVDGVNNLNTSAGHCAVLLGTPTPSLTVNLGGLHIVHNVTLQIFNQELANVVEVGYDDDWLPCNDTISSASNLTYVCDPTGVLANRVRIMRQIGTNNDQLLTLCEVMVWGYLFHNCSNRRFGPGCVMECHCSDDCDVISGACPAACGPGWNGTDCQQECPAGSWGSDCTGMCHCADPEETCWKDTGMCTSGCAEGRMGVACDANCTYGNFGHNCERDCHCLDQCDVTSGLCPASCEPGWQGLDCQQECSDGRWGSACVNGCQCRDRNETCRKDSGACTSGCEEGRVGIACNGTIPSMNGSAEITDVASDSMKLTCELWTRHSTYEIPPNAYRIQIRTEIRLEWDPVQMISSRDADTAGEISVVLGGLDAATTYQVRVFPVIFVDNAEYSGDGVTVNATTLAIDIKAAESITPVVAGVVVTLIILAAGIGIAFKFRVHERVKKRLCFKRNEEEVRFYAQQISAESGRANFDPVELQRRSETTPGAAAPDSASVHSDSASYSETSHVYANMVLLQNPIKVENLALYVTTRNDMVNCYVDEYQKMPLGQTAKWDVGDLPENRKKHRFLNINAYDHSRVILDGENPESNYINANYIPSYHDERGYIAAQGPKINTLEDTWRMIWQTKSNRVVMLTNVMEASKAKCEPYWPIYKSDKFAEFGAYIVTLLETVVYADYIIRTLCVEFQGLSRHIRHYHFIGWPDHGVPRIATSLLDFRSRVRAHDADATGPLIVHCCAGIGRTGTYMALDYLLDQARTENTVDVLHCVCLMRTDRINLVQTIEQYKFVYNALAEGLATGTTSIPCRQMAQVMSRITDDNGSRDDTLEKQFQVLNNLPHPWVNDEQAGHLPENIEKNRDDNVVPPDWARPVLRREREGTASDYINAVFVNNYCCRRAFIVTQSPLAQTLCDFWRLVQDQHCTTIVHLGWASNDQCCPTYWPVDPDLGPVDFGAFTVDCTQVEEHGDLTIRQLQLTMEGQGGESIRDIRQFHLDSWSCDSETLPAIETLLAVVSSVEHRKQTTPGVPVIVMCETGVGASGLFCAASLVLEKVRMDKEIDIRLAVALIRQTRPQFIRTLDEYIYLHQLALAYIQKFEVYVNLE